MRGYELSNARQILRRELRRAAVEELPPGLALDDEHLFDLLAGGATHNRALVIQRTLVLRQLGVLGIGADVIARRYHMSPAELVHELERPLFEASDVVAAIADQVLEELPETPEPGRAQVPSGDFGVPGMQYPLDPRLTGEGR